MGLDWGCWYGEYFGASSLPEKEGTLGERKRRGYGDILGLIDIVLGGVALQAPRTLHSLWHWSFGDYFICVCKLQL